MFDVFGNVSIGCPTRFEFMFRI